MYIQSRHWFRCKDYLLWSLSGNVRRALDLLEGKGLVEREEALMALPWAEGANVRCLLYRPTALAIALMRSISSAQEGKRPVSPRRVATRA